MLRLYARGVICRWTRVSPNSLLIWLCVVAFVYLITPFAFGSQRPESEPPSIYISRGACPFEGCVYRDWIAKHDLNVYDRAGGTAVVDHLRQGDRVHAITGEIHCRPLRVTASRDHPEPGSYEPTSPRIRKGQVYYVLHYVGEGQWKVWFRGQVTVVEGLPPGAPRPRTTWWAKVTTPRGITGWVIATDNFDGQDMLAQSGRSDSQVMMPI